MSYKSSLALTSLISLSLLVSCSGDKKAVSLLKNLPELSIVATHAIIAGNVNGIGYLPNSAAPWLGGLILTSADGTLKVTDIEGERMDEISRDIESAAGLKDGLILTRGTQNGANLAFDGSIQAENAVRASVNVSSQALDTFCADPNSGTNILTGLTSGPNAEHFLLKAEYTPENAVNASNPPLKQSIVSQIEAGKDTIACAAGENASYVLSKVKNGTRITATGKDGAQTSYLEPLAGLATLSLNAHDYLLTISDGALILLDAESLKPVYNIKITDGLSIGGLQKAAFVSATHANYGGAGFRDGFVAIGDAQTQRIVFISRSYLEDQLKTAQSE
jgi:hypothetical protein